MSATAAGSPRGEAEELAPHDEQLRRQARAAIRGRLKGFAALWPFLGPAVVASVAYVDPGNVATNIQAGAKFGYRLLWVIVVANVVAMLFQSLSAKLGIATGRSLPELCREHFPRKVVWPMWVGAEIGAMATDLAEFLGAAVGFNLLLGIPMLAAGVATGVATFVVLGLQKRGVRHLEAVIGALVGVIALSYAVETVLAKPDWGEVARHSVVPWISGDSALLAVGIVGATVMPHALYLHSGLTQSRDVARNGEERARAFKFELIDVVLAMGVAGLVNMAMLYMAAAVFNGSGRTDVGGIEEAYQTLTPLLGGMSALVFGVSLVASGLSSAAVGTMAGQMVMQGFVDFSIPVWLRRLLTMLPALAVIALGFEPTSVLVISQAVLSFVLPVPVVSLVLLTRRADLMGESLVNHRATTIAAVAGAVVIIGLNLLLLYTVFGGSLPGS